MNFRIFTTILATILLLTESLYSGRHLSIINVQHYGAKGDGVKDDSYAIQKAIDLQHDTEKIIYFPKPQNFYKITKTIAIHSASNIVLVGDSTMRSRIKLVGGIFKGILVKNSSRIRIENIHVIGQGVKSMGADAAGIKIGSSEAVEVINVRVDSAITNGIEGNNASYCVVKNSEFYSTMNYNGIGWSGGESNIFENNQCLYNRGQGIEIRSQQNSIVRKNYCAFNGESGEQSSGITVEAEDGFVKVIFTSATAPIGVRTASYHGYKSGDNVTISGVEGVPEANGHFTISNVRKDSFDLLNTVGKGKYQSGGSLLFKNADPEMAMNSEQILVEENRVEKNRGYGIYIVSAKMAHVRDITIKKNKINDNSHSGIMIATASDVQEERTTSKITVTNNTIVKNGIPLRQWGIWAYFADSIFINNNIILENGNSNVIRNAGSYNIISDKKVE